MADKVKKESSGFIRSRRKKKADKDESQAPTKKLGNSKFNDIKDIGSKKALQ